MEKMAGLDETSQVIKVTYEGAERFYRISGAALAKVSDLKNKIANMFRFFYEKGKENNAKRITKASEKMGVIELDNEVADSFSTYAQQCNIEYIPIDMRNGKTYMIYNQRYSKDIDSFVINNRATCKYTTIINMSKDINAAKKLELTTGEKKRVYDISPRQICDINKNVRTVKVNIDGKNRIDIPLSDLHCYIDRKGMKRYCIAVDNKNISIKNLQLFIPREKQTIFRYKDEKLVCSIGKERENSIIKNVKGGIQR